MMGAVTLIVGQTKIPAAAISSASAGSKSEPNSPSGPANEQCSMVSTPAATARAIPSLPCACAATRLPSRCASPVTALSSAGVNWANQGAEPVVMKPPVDMTLIRSAPILWCSRTMRRSSSAEPHSPPMNQQWPPVGVSGRPAVTSRGPSAVPRAMASRTAISRKARAPRSRAVVTPARSSCRALFSMRMSCSASVSARIRATGSGLPSKPRWTWASIRPGSSVIAPRSTTSAPGPIDWSASDGPAATI